MRILWIDASAGGSGDMILGALVDLGVPLAALRRVFESLSLPGWTLRSRKVSRRGLAGRKIDIRIRAPAPHRGRREIRRILNGAGLDPTLRRRAGAIFERLIEAEARVHGVSPDRVHLHETGGTDAILDVVGAAYGLQRLEIERIVVSRMTTGWGRIRCAHGDYPVPGPATLELVRGFPVAAGEIEAERLTPTGAAILTAVADGWGPLPAMVPERVGNGAGDRELAESPNMIRFVLGTALAEEGVAGPAEPGEVVVVQCTVDDVTPQTLAHACRRLRAAGALEIYTVAATMKKGRVGHEVTLLVRPESHAAMAELLIAETGTLGLRIRRERRIELRRDVTELTTPRGTIRIKRGWLGDREIHARPEYEDCAKLARATGRTLREVRREALELYAKQRGKRDKRKRS